LEGGTDKLANSSINRVNLFLTVIGYNLDTKQGWLWLIEPIPKSGDTIWQRKEDCRKERRPSNDFLEHGVAINH
jgi:hypothetical protein